MSWQRVQLIGKLLLPPAHSHFPKNPGSTWPENICDQPISSHEVVSHINYSKAECCEFLIGFSAAAVCTDIAVPAAAAAAFAGVGIIIFVCKQICMEIDAEPLGIGQTQMAKLMTYFLTLIKRS